MGEVNITPFEEEESFTSAGLSNRFVEVGQQGIDDLTAPAFQDGCLTPNHTPSLVSFCDTVEFYDDNMLSQVYESGYDAGTTLETGLSYWNARTVSTDGYMNYPPNDGVWGDIQDGAGNNMRVELPASVPLGNSDFDTRFGLDAILVMFNVQVERFEYYEADGTTPIAGPSTFAAACGAVFCIQISNDGTNWYHLYLGDSQYVAPGGSGVTGNPPYRYRLTERAIENRGAGTQTTALYPSGSGFLCRKDLSIRTIINADSLANTVDAQNNKGALTSFRYIRACISINKGVGGAPSMYDKVLKVVLKKANLSVMAIRASEAEPNA